MKKTVKLLLFLYLACSPLIAWNQKKPFTLSIDISESTEAGKIKRLKYNTDFSQPRLREKELVKVLHYFYDKGFLAARFDSLVSDSNHMSAFLSVGGKYQLKYLGKGNVEEEILREAGYRSKYFNKGLPYRHRRLSRLLTNILKNAENNGYPFARVSLDSIIINHDNISASLKLERNYKILIDTITVKGNARIHMNYIKQYLAIKPGDLYNESRVEIIDEKIADIPFISAPRPAEIIFTPEAASLVLFLDKKKASQFDGIIGFAPNDDKEGKLLVTGDVNLKLMNILRRGELIDFRWRALEAGTQDLKFNFVYPYLFKTPLGIDYSFYLYKRDTSYITVENHIGLNYLLKGYNYLQANFERQVSSLLSTEGLEFATTLPSYADINTSLYGLKFVYDDLDYRFNPRRGYSFLSQGAVGTKNIEKNDKVNQELYEGLQMQSTLYRIILNIAGYLPIYRNLTIMLRSQNAYISNPNLFENELYRIGGLKSLRGFDEESIYASLYSIMTCEFRYIFDVNSFVSLFWNGAYVEQDTYTTYTSDYPWGFGAGLSFETKAGIFNISYALGKRYDNPIQLRSAKIHFGLTATF